MNAKMVAFQKNLVVWKPRKDNDAYTRIVAVSEELSSVETFTHKYILSHFLQFQKNLVVWKRSF